MRRTGSSLCIALAFIAAPAALAAEPSLSMNANRTKVGVEDTFQVEVTIADAPRDANLVLPKGDWFEVLGRSESNQLRFGFGSGVSGVRSTRTYTLTLHPLRKGKFSIPPARLETSGRSYAAASIPIEVVAGRVASPRQDQDPDPQDPFNALLKGMGLQRTPLGTLGDDNDIDARGVSEGDVFVRSTLDKSHAYPGEQVTYTVYAFSRINIASLDGLKPPRLDGFYTADLRSPTTLTAERQVVDGQIYQVYTLRSRALYALRPGTLKIDPVAANITALTIFGGQSFERKSNALALKVLPLPEGGSGNLVGQWSITREISQPTVVVGDPMQIRIRVEGKGNIQNLVIPRLELPSSVRVYDPVTNDSTEIRGNDLIATRTVEYTLLPERTGAVDLPAMAITYFNPASTKWEQSAIPAASFEVAPASAAAGSGVLSADGNSKNQLAVHGPKPPRFSGSLAPPGPRPMDRRWFWIATLLPLGLAGAFGSFLLARRALESASPEANAAKQVRTARRRLRRAAATAQATSPQHFYSEIDASLRTFAQGKLARSLAGFSRSDLEATLATSGAPSELIPRILNVIDDCDMGRFAPGYPGLKARTQLSEEAMAIIEAWT